jgi:predicted GNAT family acetyltransferase
MAVNAEVAAAALTETWRHLVAAISGGWTRRDGGVFVAVTVVPVPALNVVFVDGPRADLEVVAALLDEVAAAELPHCLQARPGCEPMLAQVARRRGMTEDAEIPLMVCDDPSALRNDRPADLVIRALLPGEAPVHAKLASLGFDAPEEYFRKLMTPAVLSAPGARCYVGEVDGEPVTTAFAVTLRDFVAIFNVATPPVHRRHGYGAAVTAQAMRDGLSNGARWAWLQSSPAGYPVYQRLGFRTGESWRCWIMP